LSFNSWVSDLETVANAIDVYRFPLLGISQGAAVAIAYAVRHPDRVSHLILYGAYGRGRLVRDRSTEQRDEAQVMNKLIEIGWGRDNDAFRQVFTSQFIPGGTLEQLRAFNELQRQSCSPANATRFLNEFNNIDVLDIATKVRCPTLVLHAHGDQRVPFDEGRLLAAQIPDAQFVGLDSRNHVLLAEPAFEVLMKTTEAFLTNSDDAPLDDLEIQELTVRERQVLELIAQGLANAAIAERLGIQPKTVRNHITNIFNKLNAHSRAEAIVTARTAGFGNSANGQHRFPRANAPRG